MCDGPWEISHGGLRAKAGRRGPVQVAMEAIKAGTPELHCKTYEDCDTLLDAAAESVGCSRRELPSVVGFFGTVSRNMQDLKDNPNFEEDFDKLPTEQQTRGRRRSLMLLRGPDGRPLKEHVMGTHRFEEGHPPNFHRFRVLQPISKMQVGPKRVLVGKLKQLYEDAFIALLNRHPPPGWTSNGVSGSRSALTCPWRSLRRS